MFSHLPPRAADIALSRAAASLSITIVTVRPDAVGEVLVRSEVGVDRECGIKAEKDAAATLSEDGRPAHRLPRPLSI